ncbi:zinc ribbon domain-containing protein [Tundrisphaera sp. TA3]|uniref:zinc ribbon domain-containing protein n=1 Tax=Tundrisphaera sp. TA3 TaxID=3435775 RepID=UPI003EC0B60C
MRLVHDDEDWEDDEGEAEAGKDDETIPCPHCRRPVYEDAEQCPHCRRYLSIEDAPRRKPWWVVVGVGVCLVMVYRWIFFL